MRDKSCLFEIHAARDGMSEKERRVADFIIATPIDAVHPSIEELAEKIGVSESTLFRFVRKLGYEGYQQFRIALATETIRPTARFYDSFVEGADGEAAVSVVFKTAITALEMTMKILDRGALEKAADLLVGARSVLYLGLGGSAFVAQDAYHKLLRTGLCGSAPLDFHLQLMAASQARPEDVAILVSNTGANKDAVAVADELRRSGVPTIAITTYPRTPLAKLSTVLLISASPSSRYTSEAFSARLAQLAIVDALYVEVMERLGERGVASLEKMRGAIARRRT
ncbi:MAG: MurR/RpiR family transcriptional regulator [Spirochaetae bacterium HGW-Spirochaetae-7]|jgi:DNA-binding MurR/RpiR family transcriptional regulator|nr:MAG: MurR/RpiR family transcriptional regulator [Spirochaetae bacterium HGW-Spirochaetae-7]